MKQESEEVKLGSRGCSFQCSEVSPPAEPLPIHLSGGNNPIPYRLKHGVLYCWELHVKEGERTKGEVVAWTTPIPKALRNI